MTDFIQVSTTVAQRADAEKMAKVIVEKKIAACVQILGPLTSFFHWQGNLEKAEEYLCLIKTRKDLFPDLEVVIKDMHPYEVPEILGTPITEGGKDYLDWMVSELRPWYL